MGITKRTKSDSTELSLLVRWGIRGQVPSTKYQVPNSKFQVPSTKHQIPNTKHQIPNSKCHPLQTTDHRPQTKFQGRNAQWGKERGRNHKNLLAPALKGGGFCGFSLGGTNSKHQIPNSKYQVPSTKYQAPNSKFQIPNSKFQIPNSKFHRLPIKDYRLKTSTEFLFSLVLYLLNP